MKILSFGEIIWDVYPDKNYIGGAPLNFAAHASREGADTYLLSAVGNDELGCKAMELIKKFGVFIDYVSVNPDFETGKCIVSLDENGVPSFNVKNNAAYDNIVSVPDEYFDVVAFGTLAMRNSVSLNTLKKLLKAKKYGKIFCDINLRAPFYTKESVELCLENANILKLSDTELDYVFDTFFNIRYENLVQNFYLLCSKYPNIEEITVTYGEGGAYAFSIVEDKICYAPAKQVDVVSTVGAGDSFGASYLVSRLKGKSIEQSLKRATEVSAYVVSCKDATPMEE
jgi:fructokinase